MGARVEVDERDPGISRACLNFCKKLDFRKKLVFVGNWIFVETECMRRRAPKLQVRRNNIR